MRRCFPLIFKELRPISASLSLSSFAMGSHLESPEQSPEHTRGHPGWSDLRQRAAPPKGLPHISRG